MDLSAILAELKSAQDDFKLTDKSFATAAFCHRACKALDKVVKESENDEFENLVIGIWIVIGALNELSPELSDGPLLTELLDKLFRQCARVVLDIKWQQLDESNQCRQNFLTSLTTCHQQMAPRGFTRLGVLQSLLDNPWTDPVLTMVMGSEEDNEEGEGLAYIKDQDPEILKLRVELMNQENCDEFALNLCTWCLRHPALMGDFKLHRTQFVLLHRLSYIDKLQEECQAMGLVDSIRLINSLHGKEEHTELCTTLAQTFLVQNWIKPSDNEAKQELLRLWIRLQYQADPDQDRFISSLWAVAKVSRSTEQLLFIIDAVREQCGDTFLQFYVDLCIFAINVDKGCWEKLKNSTAAGPNEELLARKRDMAQVCDKLTHIVSHASPKIAFCCALTAFTLLPSDQSLQAVRDSHIRKSRAGMSTKSQCCSNCASDQGSCLKNADDDKTSREVNVATLYEVERLCSMLRPSYLSHDSEFPVLLTLCRQFLIKEKGEVVKSALVRRKSAVTTADVPAAAQVPSVPQRPAPVVRRTVDAGSHVSNVAIPPSSAVGGNQGTVYPVKHQVPAPAQQTELAAAVANQSIIQQLVLKQLSSDTVQTLLHLIQSGQISPVHLNQIMTKNPNMSMQILQNIVNQVKHGDSALKPATSQQTQQDQGQQMQQVHIKQEVLQEEQMSNRPRYGVPQVQLPNTPGQRGLVPSQRESGVHQHVLHHARPQAPAARPSAQVRMAGGPQHSATSQPFPVRFAAPHQAKGPPLVQQPQIVRGVQQIQPVLPSGSTIQGTRPVHIMTLKQTSPLQQSSATGKQIPVLMQTGSQMLTHLSGGSVRSFREKPQIVRLPSATVTMCGGAARSVLQPGTNLSPGVPISTMSAQGIGSKASQAAVPGSEEEAGNRHYSINNLLFTGEQQTSALSITLPDKLPEISVDSITDTLRALSDPSDAGGQVMMPKGPQQIPGTHVVSQSAARVPISRSQAPAKVLVPVASGQSRMPVGTGLQTVTRVMMSTPTAASPQLAQTPRGSGSSFTQRAQDAQTNDQLLPSISTLFAANVSPQHTTTAVGTTFAPASSFITTSPPTVGVSSLGVSGGQAIGATDVKTENKGAKKNKEILATHKDEMMRLLRQAMTLKIEKKGNGKAPEVTPSTSVPRLSVPSAQSVTVPDTGHRSTVPYRSESSLVSKPSSLARPLVQQSSLPGSTSLSAPALQQHHSSMQQNACSPSVSHLKQTTVPAVAMESRRTSQSVSSAPMLYSSLTSVNRGQRFPSFTSSGVTRTEQRSVLGHTQTTFENPISTKPLSSFQTSPSASVNVPSSTALYRSLTPRASVPSALTSTTSIPSSSGVAARTYARVDSGPNQGPRQDSGTRVTSMPIPTSILPEGGIIETGQDGDQSIATYRCIICAKAFMTLDALRLHVKQICKAGLTQPTNIDNRMAIKKAQATEAGLETSTVFQCMRCFELCISEDGIRQHKMVCRKAPKPKSRSKSKAKPKTPTPEEEKATEAKVIELLNKCLGENREKLLQENQTQAAKLADDKKKQVRKRPSTDSESSLGVGITSTEAVSNTKRPKFADPTSTESIAQSAVAVSMMAAVSRGTAVQKHENAKSVTGIVSSPVSPSITVPSHSESRLSLGTFSHATSESMAVRVSQTYTPNTASSTGTVVAPLIHVSATSPYPKVVQAEAESKFHSRKSVVSTSDGSIQADTLSSPFTAFAPAGSTETSEHSDKVFAKQKQTKETAPPPPQYRELSGSAGQSFFKCLNCGQTLCSMESFKEHWLECIVKKPLVVRPKQVARDQGPRHDLSKTDISRVMAVTTAFPNSKQIANTSTRGESFQLASGTHQVKQSVVLLEKVTLPQRITINRKNATSGDEESDNETLCGDTSDFSLAEKSGESTVESSPVASPGKPSFKKAGGLLKAIHKKQAFPGSGGVLKRRRRDVKRPCESPAKGKPQVGDSKYCRVCERFFSKRTKLIQHFASIHVQPYTLTKIDGTVSYLCHLCNKTFSMYFKYINHVTCHSQAIARQFNQMNSLGSLRNNCQISASGVKKRGLTSPREKPSGRKENEGGVRNSRSSGRQRKLLSPITSPVLAAKTTPVSPPAADRRSSSRAAQKQALNKIYISSLGITSIPEPLKENNKRRVSCDEKSPADTRPKRSRARNSTVEMDSEEDEETTESSGDEDKTMARTSDIGTAPMPSAHKPRTMEKASMNASIAPKSSQHRHGSTPLYVQCPQSSALPHPSPRVPSPLPVAHKKPSFIDSFLSFVSSRSPEAPLPINQTKRRYSYLSDRLDDENCSTLSSKPRRSSCDEQSHPVNQTSAQKSTVPVSAPLENPQHCPPSASISTKEAHKASKPKPSAGTRAPKAKSDEFDNVYYYGDFEKQLTQQCRVNLGHQIKAEEVCLQSSSVHSHVEKSVVAVKQCIVNLGPKVDPAFLPVSPPRSASKPSNSTESDVKNLSELGAAPVWDTTDDWCQDSDADTVVAADGALSPVDVTEDTISLDNMIMPASSSSADGVCVEATLSVLPLPEMLSVDDDVAALVNSVPSQVAELSCSSPLKSTVETVTVSTLSLGSPEAPPAPSLDHRDHSQQHTESVLDAEPGDTSCMAERVGCHQTDVSIVPSCASGDDPTMLGQDFTVDKTEFDTSAIDDKQRENSLEVRHDRHEPNDNNSQNVERQILGEPHCEAEASKQECAAHHLGDIPAVEDCEPETHSGEPETGDSEPTTGKDEEMENGGDVNTDKSFIKDDDVLPEVPVDGQDTDYTLPYSSPSDEVSKSSLLLCESVTDDADTSTVSAVSVEPLDSIDHTTPTSEMSVEPAKKDDAKSLPEPSVEQTDNADFTSVSKVSVEPAESIDTIPVSEMSVEPDNADTNSFPEQSVDQTDKTDLTQTVSGVSTENVNRPSVPAEATEPSLAPVSAVPVEPTDKADAKTSLEPADVPDLTLVSEATAEHVENKELSENSCAYHDALSSSVTVVQPGKTEELHQSPVTHCSDRSVQNLETTVTQNLERHHQSGTEESLLMKKKEADGISELAAAKRVESSQGAAEQCAQDSAHDGDVMADTVCIDPSSFSTTIKAEADNPVPLTEVDMDRALECSTELVKGSCETGTVMIEANNAATEQLSEPLDEEPVNTSKLSSTVDVSDGGKLSSGEITSCANENTLVGCQAKGQEEVVLGDEEGQMLQTEGDSLETSLLSFPVENDTKQDSEHRNMVNDSVMVVADFSFSTSDATTKSLIPSVDSMPDMTCQDTTSRAQNVFVDSSVPGENKSYVEDLSICQPLGPHGIALVETTNISVHSASGTEQHKEDQSEEHDVSDLKPLISSEKPEEVLVSGDKMTLEPSELPKKSTLTEGPQNWYESAKGDENERTSHDNEEEIHNHIADLQENSEVAEEALATKTGTDKEVRDKKDIENLTDDHEHHVMTSCESLSEDSAADQKNAPKLPRGVPSQADTVIEREQNHCTMSVMDFLQKSAFPVIQKSPEAELSQINGECQTVLAEAEAPSVQNISEFAADNNGDWDTCDDKVMVIALPEDSNPTQSSEITPTNACSSAGKSDPAENMDADIQSVCRPQQNTVESVAGVEGDSETCLNGSTSLHEASEPEQALSTTAESAVITPRPNDFHAAVETVSSPGGDTDQLAAADDMPVDWSSSGCAEAEPLSNDHSECDPGDFQPQDQPSDISECDPDDFQPQYPSDISKCDPGDIQPQDQPSDISESLDQSFSQQGPVCESTGNSPVGENQCSSPASLDPSSSLPEPSNQLTSDLQQQTGHVSVCQSTGSFQGPADQLEQRAVQLSSISQSPRNESSSSVQDTANPTVFAGQQISVAKSSENTVLRVKYFNSLSRNDQEQSNTQSLSNSPDSVSAIVSDSVTEKALEHSSDSVPLDTFGETADTVLLEEITHDSGENGVPGPVDLDAVSSSTPLGVLDHACDTVGIEREESGVVPKFTRTMWTEKSVSSPDTVVSEYSRVNRAVAGKSTHDYDPDSDLPELCIVPDPQGVVIKPSVDRTADKAQDETGSVSGHDMPDNSVSIVMNDYEVQVRPCKSSKTSQKVKTTYSVEIKKEKVVDDIKEENEPAPLESPTTPRKPLLGIKSLRNKHKPEPFVWEVDGEEDCKKRARNERSLKAFRQKVSVAPFTWDTDGSCQDRKRDTEKATQKKIRDLSDLEHNIQPLHAFRKTVGSGPFIWDSDMADAGKKTKVMKPCHSDKTAASNDAGPSYGTAARTVDHDIAEIHNSDTVPRAHIAPNSGQHNRKETNKSEEPRSESPVNTNKVEYMQSVTSDSPIELSISNSLAERGRTAARSRETVQSGLRDKLMQASAQSVVKKRSSSAVARKSFRKSRSCDDESSDGKAQASTKRLLLSTTEEHPKTAATSIETKPNVVNKDLPVSGSVDDLKSSQQSASSHVKRTQPRVNTRSSETVAQSPSLRKWKHGQSASGSKVVKSLSSEAKVLEQVPRRLRINRHLNLENQSNSTDRTSTSVHPSHKSSRMQNVSRQSRKMSSASKTRVQLNQRQTRSKESTEKDANSVKSTAGCDIRAHGRGNQNEANSLLACPKALRSRDASPDIMGPCLNNDTSVNSRVKSLPRVFGASHESANSSIHRPSKSRSRDSTPVKEHKHSGSKEHKSRSDPRDSVRSQRSRLSKNSAVTQSDDNLPSTGTISQKKCMDYKSNGNSTIEPTAKAAIDSVSETKDSCSSRPPHSRECTRGRLSAVKSELLCRPAVEKTDPVLQTHSLGSSGKPNKLDSPDLNRSAHSTADYALSQTQTSQSVSKPCESDTKQNVMYLGAMVRRRKQPTSWRKVNSQSSKKARVTVSEVPQYEVIRVEPVSASSPSEEHSRPQVCEQAVEPAPRTVHTKVSLGDLNPATPSPKPVKSHSDQKWLINRHIKPERRKRNIDPHFPFSFMRARARTQTK